MPDDKRIINASSLVERKIARSVPTVIYFCSNNFAAMTENPHWGINPVAEPMSGPNFPLKRLFGPVKFVLCSMSSIMI